MIRNPSAMRRLAAGDSYTFLMKELEKVDDVILEPLTGTDWPRDMPVITEAGREERKGGAELTADQRCQGLKRKVSCPR